MGHLVFLREVHPQLGAEHEVGALGHLLVDDAAACGHPLTATVVDGAGVAQAVAMLDLPLDEVGHRLNASVRMPGKALEVVFRIVRIEGVEHEEGIEFLRIIATDDPDQLDAGTVILDGTAGYPLDRSYTHRCPPLLPS